MHCFIVLRAISTRMLIVAMLWPGREDKGRSMQCIFSLELRFVSRVIARGSADNCNFSAPLERRLL